MDDKIVQVNFRMPAALKADLESAAHARGRTLTAEIVHRLSASIQTDHMTGSDFLSILEVQAYNGHRIVELLREATARMESLMSADLSVEDVDAVQRAKPRNISD